MMAPVTLGLLVGALLLMGPAAGTGQSFDCRMAATAVEKMICADKELAALDEDWHARSPRPAGAPPPEASARPAG